MTAQWLAEIRSKSSSLTRLTRLTRLTLTLDSPLEKRSQDVTHEIHVQNERRQLFVIDSAPRRAPPKAAPEPQDSLSHLYRRELNPCRRVRPLRDEQLSLDPVYHHCVRHGRVHRGPHHDNVSLNVVASSHCPLRNTGRVDVVLARNKIIVAKIRLSIVRFVELPKSRVVVTKR